MKKILLSCMMLLGLSASAQIVVNESFEGTSLPSGFTSVNDTGGSISPSYGAAAGPACAGVKAIYRNVYGTSTNQKWNVIYSSTTPNASALTYSFSYLAKGYDSSSPVAGTVQADYSIDGGATYISLLAPVTLAAGNGGSIPCTTINGTIPAGAIPANSNFKFKLRAANTAAGDYYMGFDNVQLTQTITSAPACTTPTAPANAATGVSVTPTLSYGASGGTSSYLINLGSTPGGTNVLNAFNNGTSTSYALPAASALMYSTTYYLSVSPSNAIGTATGCTSTSFTTVAIPCPSVSAPAINATNQPLQPTISWSAITGTGGYKLSVGTTAGGTNVLNNVDLGNVTSYTFPSDLAVSTAYFYTVTTYQGANTSAGCTERKFTTGTVASPVNNSCSGAIALTTGGTFAQNAVVGTNVGSSTGSQAHSCGVVVNSVWYSAVVPASGTLTVETGASTAATNLDDTIITVYSGTCAGTLTEKGCNDDGSGLFSKLVLTGLIPGETVLISVWSYGSAEFTQGSFRISAYDGSLATSETNMTDEKSFTVAPNPFTDVVRISDMKDVVSVSVVDMAGRMVKTVKPAREMNLGDLKSGMYLINLTMKDGSVKTLKAVKK